MLKLGRKEKVGLFSMFNRKNKQYHSLSDSLVLIGTVKSSQQIDLCLKEKFYHIPFSLLVPEHFANKKELYRVKYISLYQSANLFGENAGIKYIGKVKSLSIVKRKDIKQIPKESNALYVFFEIDSWQVREEPIKITEIGIYPVGIVTFGNFKASSETPELFLSNATERELYRLLRKMSMDVNLKSFEFGGYMFYDENDTLVIMRNEECFLQLPMEVIRNMPQSGYETVINSIAEVGMHKIVEDK